MYVIKDLTFKTFEALVTWSELEYGIEFFTDKSFSSLSEEDKREAIKELEKKIDEIENGL
jgi:hypothetical protein